MLTAPATSQAFAQSPVEIQGVQAASKDFYDAIAVIDDGAAMGRVWAQRPYVTYVGPHSTSIIVGWDAQRDYWADFNKTFAGRSVSVRDAHIHAVGNLAWEIGSEVGEAQMKDGSTRKVDWLVTNIYEKIDGRWLIVSHHVQPKPQ